MLKKILYTLAALIAAFLLFVATRPAEFKIERSLAMNAPPSVVFAFVNDFQYWSRWSPWEKLDPAMTKEHSGSPSGEGAVYYWKGNDQVGEGRMTITESDSAERVAIKLEFLQPWQATNQAIFTFTDKGKDTEVNWAMEGNHNFMGKLVSLFMDMDAVVGKDFEAGLAALKPLAEGEAKRLRELKEQAAAKAKAELEAAAAQPTDGAQATEGAVMPAKADAPTP